MPDSRFEAGVPFSDDELAEVEAALGERLPGDYRSFLKEYGGASVGGLVDGSEELPILVFFGTTGHSGLLSTLDASPDLKERGALPIARCELGNLWVLDLGLDGSVHYIDYYGGETTARGVSDSFGDFLERIVIPEEDE